jgi:hypothetical protein
MDGRRFNLPEPIFAKGLDMSQDNDNPKDDASNEGKVAAVSTAALAGLTTGTLAFGTAVGIALALIWGIQAAMCAMCSKNADSDGAG